MTDDKAVNVDRFTWEYRPDGAIALISRSGHKLWFDNWEHLRAFGWVMINAADHHRAATTNREPKGDI